MLRYPLIQLPQIIAGLVAANVSMERLRDFLMADTVPEQQVQQTQQEAKEQGEDSTSSLPTIAIDGNASFAWDVDSEDADLSNLGLEMQCGELLTVVGRTGSGKSSLLSVVLNELSCLNATPANPAVQVTGSIAYVPQESWIFNSTLRENILFGEPYDKVKYDTAVRVSQMTSDFEQMADGDMTEIGERGVNLSGGQRQRVSIARAVYSDADIYLFDDPLSALDAKVARKVYDECICGILKSKTIILVTNRVEFVGGSDRVALMSDGGMSGVGTNAWMLENVAEFNHMMEGISDVSSTTNIDDDGGANEDGGGNANDDAKDSMKDAKTKEEATEKSKSSSGKGALIAKEHRDKGSIKWSVVLAYGRAMGGLNVLFSMIALFALTEGVNVASTYWVSYWASDHFSLGLGSPRYLGTYVGGYAGFSFAAITLTLISAYLQTYSSLAAAKSLHSKMIQSLLRAPMSFFHATPLGRILNRFSKDQNDVDKVIEFATSLLVRGCVQLTSTFIVIGLATPYTLLTFVPVLFAFVYVQRYVTITLKVCVISQYRKHNLIQKLFSLSLSLFSLSFSLHLLLFYQILSTYVTRVEANGCSQPLSRLRALLRVVERIVFDSSVWKASVDVKHEQNTS